MKVTYKAAEDFFLFIPGIVGFIARKKITGVLNEYLVYFRIAFVASLLIDLSLAYYVKGRIAAHKVQTKVSIPADDPTVITREGAEGEKEGDEQVSLPVFEYDTRVIDTHISKVISSSVISIVIHLVFKSPHPLAMQALNPLKNLIFFPLYIEYLRGRPMLRPFSKNVMFEFSEERESRPAEEKKTEEALGAPSKDSEEEPLLDSEEEEELESEVSDESSKDKSGTFKKED